MTVEYFVAGTNTPYTVNSNFTVSDIDANQYFKRFEYLLQINL